MALLQYVYMGIGMSMTNMEIGPNDILQQMAEKKLSKSEQ